PQPWVMLIDPPWIPYAPALQQQGLALSRLMVIHTGISRPVAQHIAQKASRRAFHGGSWALEEALGAGACAGIVAWMEAVGVIGLRRLQLAASRTSTWVVLIRSGRFRRERSPAALRLELTGTPAD